MTIRRLLRASLALAAATSVAACSGASVTSTGGSTASAPPLEGPFVAEKGGRPLGSPPDAALDTLAANASAGTLLARSTDGRTCIFANGRNGWNRAAC